MPLDPLLGYILTSVGSITLVFLVLMYLFIRYPENMERIASMLLKIAAYFSKKAEKKRITTYINSNIEIGRKDIEKTVSGVMPFGISVEFIDDIEDDSIMQRDGVLILKMKSHKNDSENLARAVAYYVTHGLLPYSKRYLDEGVSKTIDLIISKKLIGNDTVAINYIRNVFRDVLKKEDYLEIVEKMEKIDEEGFLERIILREYQKFSMLYPKEPSKKHKKESKDFANFVYNVVTKKPKERINLGFDGDIIKIRIVPLMSSENIDIDNHYRFMQHAVKNGWKYFYIVAAGKNVNVAKNFVDTLTRDITLRLEEIYRDTYEGKYRGRERRIFCSLLRRKNDDKNI